MRVQKHQLQDSSALLAMIGQSKRAYLRGEHKTAQQAFSDIRKKVIVRHDADIK